MFGGLKDWALTGAGNVFVIILAVGGLYFWASDRHAKLAAYVISGAVVAAIIFNYDTVFTFLTNLAGKIFDV
jgi:hypothetical protein|nr:hypothetical protein [uncultured Actinomyces sp.]